ncbi:uncharacterized protein G2W53_014190 [Senna tora]|uniref:Uncharacterized protein n=1 Tax=Senna tora TaxID=362788 RepID=A0A835C7J8_9FABA|nr:uncharacterized protein G2W53_014190 [Senna tora]
MLQDGSKLRPWGDEGEAKEDLFLPLYHKALRGRPKRERTLD